MKKREVLGSYKSESHKKYGVKCLSMAILCSFALSGCGVRSAEEDNLVILEPEKAGVEYKMAVVTIGDVVKTEKVRCEYEQVSGRDIAFSVSGKVVKDIHVEVGDKVAKGQLLAELDIGDVTDRIEELEYKIARNKLLLSHVEENENNEVSSKWLKYIYETAHTEEKEEALKESVADLQQQNRYKKEDYQDTIDMDTLELSQIKKEVEGSYLYAPIDGVVTYVRGTAVGTTSKADRKIISIMSSGTDGIFVVDDVSYASYFEEGDEIDLSIMSGLGAGDYKIVPYKMNEWQDKLYFTFADETEGTVIKAGYAGSIKIVTGTRENVLTIPLKSVHTADDKKYVYVIGEGNVRDIKWIETGLYGDSYVEVLSGLSEGEKVILK